MGMRSPHEATAEASLVVAPRHKAEVGVTLHVRETHMTRMTTLAISVALISFVGASVGRAEDDQAALLKTLPEAKISLQQGIAQVAKGSEVATEAKYEMDKGKLALTVYTSSKGFDTAAGDNGFNEYGGDATAATWKPDKEVFADLKHIARSAQYHTLLSMTKMTIPTIIQRHPHRGPSSR
jgi:hypothetical protein